MPYSYDDFKASLRARIAAKVPPGPEHDAEVDRRLQEVLDLEVPTDAELIALEDRGCL